MPDRPVKRLPRWLNARLRDARLKLGLKPDWYLLLAASLIGLVMSGVAIAFITPLRMIEEWSAEADRSLGFDVAAHAIRGELYR